MLLEVIVPRESDEDQHQFETQGRPVIQANYVREAYAAGIVPDLWKLEGTMSREGAALVDQAIAGASRARFLVLGKAARFGQIERWFAAARTMTTAAGFAIGRTAYWDPCTTWALNGQSRQDAVEAVAANYERLVAAWDSAARSEPPRFS